MPFMSYVDPADIKDQDLREMVEAAMRKGRAGQELMSLRAHHPVFLRWWQEGKKWMREGGVLEPELKELMRARVATGWESLLDLPGCHY